MTPVEAILDARIPQDIFGELPADQGDALGEARRIYNTLARETHPDKVDGDGMAFSRLTDLYQLAQKLIMAGDYHIVGLSGLAVKAKARTYTIYERFFYGDICDTYRCSHGLIRIGHLPQDNDLLRNEAMTLKKIRREIEEKWQVYLPELTDSFSIRDSSNRDRHANVIKPLLVNLPVNSDSWYPLSRLVRAFPKGVNPRDAAWIWRRMLICIGLAHDSGYINHSALPTSFMIQPPEHGVILLDWTCAKPFGEKPSAIQPKYKSWYPQEVLDKQLSDTATDVYMAALSIIQLMGGDPLKRTLPDTVPRPLRAYFKACTLSSVNKRSDDARRLLDNFDEIIERLWGPRQFRPFPMPAHI